MRYIDTSALLALYHAESLSAKVSAAVTTRPQPLAFTWLHELEFQNALRLKRYRGEANEAAINAAIDLIRADADCGLLRRVEPAWPAVYRHALSLSLAYSADLGTRSLDVLHVALSCVLRASEFLTCDQRQAALAEAAGITVTLISLE